MPHWKDTNVIHREMANRVVDALGVSEPPIAVYYAHEMPEGAFEWNCQGPHFCPVGRLAAVRKGTPLSIDGENPGCGGAAFFLGWRREMRPGFEYFLSHDDEGHGERFKKTPELVRKMLAKRKFVPANGRYCIFQRLEDVPDEVTPEVMTIFAEPDQIGALVFLANYDRPGDDAVISPFSSSCGSIVTEPRAQASEPVPKAVIGMFDVAARPEIEKNHLTFSAPYSRFLEMVEHIPGSFLEIEPWLNLKNR